MHLQKCPDSEGAKEGLIDERLMGLKVDVSTRLACRKASLMYV